MVRIRKGKGLPQGDPFSFRDRDGVVTALPWPS